MTVMILETINGGASLSVLGSSAIAAGSYILSDNFDATIQSIVGHRTPVK